MSAVVVGWWPLLLISGLPVSASSSWGNPARGSLRQFRAANLVTAATRSPAVSGKHNRGDSCPSKGVATDEEVDWIGFEEERESKCLRR